MEAVAAEAGLVKLRRQRESLGDVRVRPVERRVEAGHLRNLGSALEQGGDRREVVKLVQRRQRDELLQRFEDTHVRADRRGKLEAAVDDPVADPDELVVAELLAEELPEVLHRVFVGESHTRAPRPLSHDAAGGIPGHEPRCRRHGFDLASYLGLEVMASDEEQRKLEEPALRTTIASRIASSDRPNGEAFRHPTAACRRPATPHRSPTTRPSPTTARGHRLPIPRQIGALQPYRPESRSPIGPWSYGLPTKIRERGERFGAEYPCVGRADNINRDTAAHRHVPASTAIGLRPETASSCALGTSSPLGSTPGAAGTNFSVFSSRATGIDLLLFDRVDDSRPARVIRLDAEANRTYHYWHIFVPDVRSGQLYGYRVEGPSDPARGLRFDPAKVLLDPYGLRVAVPAAYSRDAASRPGDNAATAMKSVVVDTSAYEWDGDTPLRRPSSRTIVYEMHVRGFTRHPSSGLDDTVRGTFAGVIQKVPYLQRLGITAVELLPVFQFDAQDCPPAKINYWGYAPVSFFAPHQQYSSRQDPLGPLDEFRDMVKALHRAGIEVILDVVFNHTAEGGLAGPTLCFRGLDDRAYYILERDASYANYSGTGNTLNANQSVVRRMILDSLRYWVQVMHVDGFRFDLASILARDTAGCPLPEPPVLWDIESDPVLAGTKLIAEAWDAAGLYQVGSFIGDSWKEWNGRFRDDVRAFFRGEPGSVRKVADRIVGSPEIYGHERRDIEQSVNFVTCHDGFTLNDLVSYDRKHNEANGEANRDGADDNRSWNCGVEGPTDDPAVQQLRNRQVKNFLTVTILSLGVPMILMGDEVRRTQGGNNNAYCQDDETSWFDWRLCTRHADVHRFVTLLNARRVLRDVEHERQRVSLTELLRRANKAWHGVKLYQPDWADHSHSLALSAELAREGLFVYQVLNAYWEPLEFELPPVADGGWWRRWIDTSLPSPHDIAPWQTAPPVSGPVYRAGARSVAVLFREAGGERTRSAGEESTT